MKGAIRTTGLKNRGSKKLQHVPISFNVAELHSKLVVYPDDILLAETDETDSRNKRTYIKNEKRFYTLMNVTFARLLSHARKTIMVNKNTLIAIDTVHDFQYDIITLKNLFTGWDGKQVILSRKFKAAFYARLRLKRPAR